MAYTRNRPTASEFISDSQSILFNNTNAADDSFGVDHYKFSDVTANNGFHNQVTTPLIVGSAHPTTTTNPILYAMQDTANLGVLQYSRGPNDAVPSPLTEIHSGTSPISLTNGSTTNIMDFTGITQAMATLFVWNASDSSTSRNFFSHIRVFWHLLPAPTPFFRFITTQSTSVGLGLAPLQSTNILQVQNQTLTTVNNVYWTLIFHRIDI